MPTPMHNPNVSRGQSSLSTPQMTQLPSTPGKSQRRPAPKKEVPSLGAPTPKPQPTTPTNDVTQNGAKNAPTSGGQISINIPDALNVLNAADAKPQNATESTPNMDDKSKMVPVGDNENVTSQKQNGAGGTGSDAGDGYSDDFEPENDNENSSDIDPIDMVREATFQYNEEEFQKKLRVLSAEARLPVGLATPEDYERDMSTRREIQAARQIRHEDWLQAFKQKKTNVLARLGVLMKDKGDRFHRMCAIIDEQKDAFTPRQMELLSRAATGQLEAERTFVAKKEDKGEGEEIKTPKLDASQELPEIVDLGEQLKHEHSNG